MTGQHEHDELYDIKNNFYIGNYQACVNEAQKLKLSSTESEQEKCKFLYRALLRQRKYGVVAKEIKSTSPKSLQYLLFISKYFQFPEQRTSLVNELDQELNKSFDQNDSTLFIVAATIYCHEENYEAALRVLNQSEDIECRAWMVHCYLKMDRHDAAKKELKTIQEKDDDATLTQLAQAWVHISSGGEKLQDAYYIYQEIMDKNTPTSLLLNGQAACFIGQSKYEEAESVLQESLNKDSNNPETLINLMTLAHLSSKSLDVANRYLAQLKDDHQNLKFVQDIQSKEMEFDRVAAMYA